MQDKLTEGVYQAAAFGDTDKRIRRQRPLRASRPAQQRFHTFHHQRISVDDRLIPDIELFVLQSLTNAILDIELILPRVAERVVIPGGTPFASLFRVVHGNIGATKKLRAGAACRHAAGNTDTGADIDFASAQDNRCV